MSISLGQLLIWVIIGALAGLIAGQLFRGRGFGTLGNIAIGLIGAIIGGILFNVLGISLSGLPTFTFSLGDLLVAIVGALILLLILGFTPRRYYRRR
jgi:uncharacterized membrane protein YeaQ/YmgE (transglycosylase-associated protein family)